MIDSRTIRICLEHLELKDEAGRFITARPHLVELALRIAELYQEGCRQIKVGAQPINRRNIIHLYNAAVLCESCQETPELFVATQLRGMLQFSKLWVNSLASRLIHDTAKSQVDIKVEAIRYYKAQLALFDLRCRLYGPALALEDEANDFSPLFRYVIAHDLGLTHVADAYASAAKTELTNNPVARDVFGNRLEQLGIAATAFPPFAGADITF